MKPNRRRTLYFLFLLILCFHYRSRIVGRSTILPFTFSLGPLLLLLFSHLPTPILLTTFHFHLPTPPNTHSIQRQVVSGRKKQQHAQSATPCRRWIIHHRRLNNIMQPPSSGASLLRSVNSSNLPASCTNIPPRATKLCNGTRRDDSGERNRSSTKRGVFLAER